MRLPRISRRRTQNNSSSETSDNMNSQFSGTDNINDTDYARRCKELMQLRNDLNEMGANGLLDLPRVVVIGSQSAGKSSLVEGVSGISVPRDAGTCTRCPMECIMHSTSKTWWCSISLRKESNGAGETTIPFCSKVTDRTSVELWLRRAQAAALSPHLPEATFVNKSRDELKRLALNDNKALKFSNTVVCLDLYDPDAADLSFVDLPGLIQNESQEAIELVKDLVVSYISRQNTLILVTIPITDDIENQQAMRLAREADPEGRRTIGVVTKPDCLPAGAIDSRKRWKDTFLGRTHKLYHGYYCVRLPDDSERKRNATRAESQQIASRFFQTTPPWSDPEMDQHRFGIPNMIADLSQLLVELIERSLPSLKEQVAELLRQCLEEIKTLPPGVIRDPQSEVLIRISNFSREVSESVEAKVQKNYVQRNRALYQAFKHDIRATAPNFQPFVKKSGHIPPEYNCEENEDLEHPVNTEPLDLTDVRKVIKDSTGWELPGHVPYEATKTLIEKYIALWEAPTLACLNKVFQKLEVFMDKLLSDHFSQFKLLRHHVRGIITREMEKYKQKTLLMLQDLLKSESSPIFTQNTHYYQENSEKWLNAYTYICDHPTPNPTSSPQLSPYLRVVEVPRAVVRTSDMYKEELKVMASVRAYFQVSYKRIIDAVPLAIEHDLNRTLADSLNEALIQSLVGDRDSSERMKELVAEDPDIAHKRAELADRHKRLQVIHRRLEEFGSG